MWPIALSTFKEVYRKRVVHVIGLLTLLYWGILGFVLYMQPREFDQGASLISALVNLSSLISILGFYLSSMLLAFLTIMLSVGIISSEVEDGTVLTILTKPIPRASYVLGKYVGISLMILAYAAVLYIGIILFALLGKQNFLQLFGLVTLLKGFLLFALQPLAIAALAVYGSTVFKTVNNGIFVISFYLLGIIGGIMEQVGSLANIADLSTFGIIAGLFAPFEVIYRKMISTIFSSVGGFNLIMGMGMPGKSVEPSVWMMAYVAIYMMGLIFWGIRRMNRRDIG
jgi:ABC-2 type transport system permease protein